MKKNNKTSAAKIAASKPADSKKKTTTRRASTQPPPTKEDVQKALAARKALPKDIEVIRGLRPDGEAVEKYEPIVFSDTWYEFSVFCRMLHVSSKTVGKWLENGWIAYSKIGRFRIINKFDFEDMMMRFRVPARV